MLIEHKLYTTQRRTPNQCRLIVSKIYFCFYLELYCTQVIDAFLINILNEKKTSKVFFNPQDRRSTEKLFKGEPVEQSFLKKVSYFLN